ncbi:hypothetical protein ACQ1PV_01885 [Ornithobacterium rhinotracheale]
MKPEDVKPTKFNKHTILYDNGVFSVAYGIWENSDNRLAMRWNGYQDEIGYPSQGGNPLWFQLPSESIWTIEILEALEKIKKYEETMEDLERKINK